MGIIKKIGKDRKWLWRKGEYDIAGGINVWVFYIKFK